MFLQRQEVQGKKRMKARKLWENIMKEMKKEG